MNVTVVGAGKMGLPLACQFANRGAKVIVCDIRRHIVDEINRGECPIDEPGIPELLSRLVAEGSLRASTDTPAAAAGSEVIVVIVPVLLTPDNDADTSIIESVSRQIATAMRPGSMVVYETTLPVGKTRQLAKLLETGGRKAGVDFDVVFSPERVKSQLVLQRLTENVKIVGGITAASAERAAEFYAAYLGAPVRNVGTLEAAEMVKLVGMVYRDVNIALANEVARYAELAGVDLHSILDAINTDGEAAMLIPGIGVGGHCAPVYPYFMIRDAERRGMAASMTLLGRTINDSQAGYSLDRIEKVWQPLKGKEILLLGLGFRPQVKEHICSTAFLLRDEAQRRGATVFLNDSLYTSEEIRSHNFTPRSMEGPLPPVVVLNTAHREYANLDFHDLRRRGVEVALDGRAVWDPQEVQDAGLLYIGVGRPVSAPENAAAVEV